MEIGAITSELDVAQVVLYAFWIFFAGLIFYLRREDRREGYPLEHEATGKRLDHGIIWIPPAKTFWLPHGGTLLAPRDERDTREIRAAPTAPWTGAPLQPTGDPMRDGVGPAAHALRTESPELTFEGQPRMVPMRVASDFSMAENDPDLRGMPVVAADGVVAGTIHDVWVDRAEPQIRFLEVEVKGEQEGGAENGIRRVLLPTGFARIDVRRRRITVKSIRADQFGHVPTLANADQITAREEDRITAYYGGGHLYALPSRQEPML